MMIAFLDLLTDPWAEVFMRRAFIVAAGSGIVCGVIGTFVVLRGMAFIGDAVAHAVFPGVALGYVLQVNLAVSGALAGVVVALLISGFSQNRRIKEDTLIGVLFAFAFGSGIVLISTQASYTGDLTSFLFGQILGISDGDVRLVVIAGSLLVLTTLLVRKELVTVSLDRETARAAGLPTARLDALLYVMVTLAIVISLQAVGNILALALLVTPAATARLLTDRLGPMMLIAAAIGASGSIAGLYISYYHDLASGGLIVMVLTGAFVAAWVAAPRYGLLGRRIRRSSTSPGQDDEGPASARALEAVADEPELALTSTPEATTTPGDPP